MKNQYLSCVVALTLVTAMMTSSPISAAPSTALNTTQMNGFKRFVINGDQADNGIYDPSIEYGDDGVGWMAYSRVSIPDRIETHLAKSTDHGATWTYVSTVNAATSAAVNSNGQMVQGVWRYETPALVYDRTDTAARRWKLFAQHYFVKAPYGSADRDMADGWIEVRYAATPQGPWSAPDRMFGRANLGARIDPNTLDVSLARNYYYNELGILASDGVLYLSMDASTTPTGQGDWSNRKIVMLASYDHAKTWRYIGVLAGYGDAMAAGYLTFTGSSLVEERGRLFAMLTPSGSLDPNDTSHDHDGTYIVEFEDITSATLKRDANGHLIVVKALNNASTAGSGGLSDYDEHNTAGGMLLPQLMPTQSPAVFQIYNTGERIID